MTRLSLLLTLVAVLAIGVTTVTLALKSRHRVEQIKAGANVRVIPIGDDGSNRWADVARAHRAAGREYDATRALLERAKQEGADRVQLSKATEAFEVAARGMRFYEALLALAVQIDGGNLDVFRRMGLPASASIAESCERLSIADIQRILISARLLDPSDNGTTGGGGAGSPKIQHLAWNRANCQVAVRECADALAVLRVCGLYKGPLD